MFRYMIKFSDIFLYEVRDSCLGSDMFVLRFCRVHFAFAVPLYPRIETDHFTVVGLVTWSLNDSEAGVDLVLIQTSLLLLCKSSCSYAN